MDLGINPVCSTARLFIEPEIISLSKSLLRWFFTRVCSANNFFTIFELFFLTSVFCKRTFANQHWVLVKEEIKEKSLLNFFVFYIIIRFCILALFFLKNVVFKNKVKSF
jgi:hypothetical protein